MASERESLLRSQITSRVEDGSRAARSAKRRICGRRVCQRSCRCITSEYKRWNGDDTLDLSQLPRPLRTARSETASTTPIYRQVQPSLLPKLH